jgi:hypothetical protein
MRKPSKGYVTALILATALGATLGAQITLQPTPPPAVTAENESWYQGGGPISYAGNLYYPAGAITHFLRNEMKRTGTYGNVPIYIRTTQEPGSIVYVPLPGGLMKPYERRRSGDLAGTVGSTAPSFVISLPAAETNPSILQAPAPPTGVPVGSTGFIPTEPSPAPEGESRTEALPSPVGTVGPLLTRTRIQTVQRPVGLNAVFVEFQGARWFSAGSAVEYSADRFTPIGEHRGFTVYQQKEQPGVIYMALLPGTPGLVAPYRHR